MLDKGKVRTADSLLTDDLSDIGGITELNVSEKGISSLKGIEYFTGLEVLYAQNNFKFVDPSQPPLSPEARNNIISLDLSVNLNLRELNVCYNQLTSLDVTCLVNLEILNVESNNIEDIDLYRNLKLSYLDISYNQLTHIDVSSLVELNYIAVNNNYLESLDLSRNEKLSTVIVGDNILENIDLPISDELLSIQAPNNYLKEIDVSKNTKLIALDLESNLLENLNVEKNISLMILTVMLNDMNSPEDVVGWNNSVFLKLDVTFFFYPQRGSLLPPSGLSYNKKGTVTWETVEYANGYIVYIDDGIVQDPVDTTFYDMKNVLSLSSYLPIKQDDRSEMKIEISSAILDYKKNTLAESKQRSEPLFIEIHTFEAPVISIDEDGHTLRWDAIPDAPEELELEYMIFIDSNEVGEEIKCYLDGSDVCYDLSECNLKADTDIRIRALSISDEIWLSEISNTVSYQAPNTGDPGYTVTFDSDGGTPVADAYVDYQSKVAQPANPTKDGYTFIGWFDGDTLYDFNAPVTSDLTLTAVWKLAGDFIPVTSIKIDAPAQVTVLRSSKYTFGLVLNPGSTSEGVIWTVAPTGFATVNPTTGEVFTQNKTGTVLLTATDNASGLSSNIILRII